MANCVYICLSAYMFVCLTIWVYLCGFLYVWVSVWLSVLVYVCLFSQIVDACHSLMLLSPASATMTSSMTRPDASDLRWRKKANREKEHMHKKNRTWNRDNETIERTVRNRRNGRNKERINLLEFRRIIGELGGIGEKSRRLKKIWWKRWELEGF